MPPVLALLLCSIFVAALLKLEYRRFKPLSISGWIPTIWLMYCASKALGVWFETGQGYENVNVSAGSPMDRVFLSILIGVGLLILARRKIDWPQIVKDNKWIFFLFLFMLVSVLWSNYPFVSLKRWIKASGTVLMALVILTGPSPLKEIEAIFRRTVFILIPFSMLLIKYFPHYGVRWGRYSGVPMWVGVTVGKNALGVLCMISAFLLIWGWSKRRKEMKQDPSKYDKYEIMGQLVVLALAIWMLRGVQGAYSATSIGVLFIGLATLFTLRGLMANTDFRVITGMFVFITAVGFLLMWGVLSMNPVEVVLSLTGRDTSLTGRTDGIWAPLMVIAMKHPILGVGYGGFWIDYMEFPKMVINEAHNGYLDVFIEVGVVGLIFLVILIFIFFRKGIDMLRYDVEWGEFQIILLLMSLIHNITESSYLRPTLFIWNVLVMLMVACPSKSEAVASQADVQRDFR